MTDKMKESSCGVINKNQSNTPAPPDPTFSVTRFLSWLLKRGAVVDLNECKRKWGSEGLDIEDIIKKLSPKYLRLYRSRGGEKVVKLENQAWASQWMSYYDLEVPHHRQKKRLEKIFSVTESKTKV
jgi:hypothetical protein